MSHEILFGFGFVAVIEGLVLALAPLHLEQVLRLLSDIGADKARLIGLASVTIGTVLIWLAS